VSLEHGDASPESTEPTSSPGTAEPARAPDATESAPAPDASESTLEPDPAGPPPAPEPDPGRRSTEGRLARLHLRVGLLALARAELETMAADGILDVEAMADLAEARWRSGDLVGAGEAAQAHLGSGGDETLAHVVAAESLAAQGRTADARRHVAAVMERAGRDVETLFSGQPRSRVWPQAEAAAGAGARMEGGPEAVAAGSPPMPREGTAALDRETPSAAQPTRPMPQAVPQDEARRVRHDAGDELAAVRADLDAGRLAAVAARLSLLVRSEPRLAAPIVGLAEEALEHVDPDGLEAASLHLVRGDAYRLLGRELEAVAAFQGSRRPIKTATGDAEPSGATEPETHEPDDHHGPEETT
jgi:hypothetical protein